MQFATPIVRGRASLKPLDRLLNRIGSFEFPTCETSTTKSVQKAVSKGWAVCPSQWWPRRLVAMQPSMHTWISSLWSYIA